MIGSVVAVLESSDLTLWFVSVWLQTTLLAILGLLASRLATRTAITRHCILTATLFFILVAPLSTYLLQRTGYGFLAIPNTPTNTAKSPQSSSVDSIPLENENSRSTLRHAVEPASESSDRSVARLDFLNTDASTANKLLTPPSNATANSDAPMAFVASNMSADTSLQAHTPLPQPTMWKHVTVFFVAVWICGGFVMSARWLVAWLKLKQMIRLSPEADDDDIHFAYRTACGLVDCDTNLCRVVTSSQISTPVVTGVLSPTIMLPRTLASTVSKQQLVEILIHELAHVVRRDQMVLVLQQFARILFWPNPLVEQICQRLTRASEEICDNYVLMQTESTTYSRTLLTVAELTAGVRTPLGTIGMLGCKWSLTERVAGLLDSRRNKLTQLNGRSKYSVALIAICWSTVLLITFRNVPQPLIAQPPLVKGSGENSDMEENFRGSGDELEFRLRGSISSTDGVPLANPKVVIRENSSNITFSATVMGNSFEVWLPAKSFKWLILTLIATSDNGYGGGRSIHNSQLRTAIAHGADIELQRRTTTYTVITKHNDQVVPNAYVKATSSGHPSETFARCNATGEATFELSPDDRLLALTAWTDSGLLGGYQFHQGPPRDPKKAEHVVELMECQQRKIHVVSSEGAPVEGVRVKLHTATPPPHFNYVGTPPDSDVITDAIGTAYYRWSPKLEGAHCYAELRGETTWLLGSQRNTDDAVEIEAIRPAERVRVEGYISRGGKQVGGIVVQARSFQGETDGHSDVRIVIADPNGKFSFDALPHSTYALLLIDEQLVSEPTIFTPMSVESRELVSPHLMALEGYPVTVQLTSGTERKPMAGQTVSLRSNFEYSWKENGEKKYGVESRDIYVTTDEFGLATARVPLGQLHASVYTAAWRSESKIDVTAEKANRIELHREQTESAAVTGRLFAPPFTEINLAKASVMIRSLDGASGDEFTPTVDAEGIFRFQTVASSIGCFAYTDDGALAGAILVDNVKQPFELELHPSAYLEGQLLGADGQPLANHSVYAEPRLNNPSLQIRTIGFSSSMVGRAIEVKSDSNGNYRIGPLPRQTEISLWCAPLDSQKSSDREYLGKSYVELDEQRPKHVHRIGEASSKAPKLSVAERLAIIQRDAKLGGFHVMVLLADYSDEKSNNFVEQHLLNYDDNINVSHYMQIRIDTGDSLSDLSRNYLVTRNWPTPSVGTVAAIALDGDGKELGRTNFEVATSDAKAKATTFVETHLPPVVDARQKWEDAFELAKKTNRRVWIRVSQRYCGPCHLLNRWLDDHRELLEKEFVMLKIDDVRDLHGTEIAAEIMSGKQHGIPFFAFYNGDQEMIINSESRTGNIGFMSGYESKRHFRKMLEKGNRRLTNDEIEQLLTSLKD